VPPTTDPPFTFSYFMRAVYVSFKSQEQGEPEKKKKNNNDERNNQRIKDTVFGQRIRQILSLI
jgi:hypothetical protein